jgi:hypothetical protein
MSDSKPYVFRYRMTLADSEPAFSVVAVLLREGRQTDAQLAEALGDSVTSTRAVLRDLYRADIVALDRDWYSLSDFGANAAWKFGLPSLAIRSMLSKTGLGEQEQRFLDVCYQWQEQHDPQHATRIFVILRTWSHLSQHLTADDLDTTALEARVPFAILVGLDPDLHKFGASDYCRYISSSFKSRNSDEGWGRSDLSGRMIDLCVTARSDAVNGERLALFGEHAHGGEAGDVSVIFALVYLLTLVGLNEPNDTPALLEGHLTWLSRESWQNIEAWRPGVLSRVVELLRNRGFELPAYEPDADPSAVLRTFFEQRLKKAASLQTIAAPDSGHGPGADTG